MTRRKYTAVLAALGLSLLLTAASVATTDTSRRREVGKPATPRVQPVISERAPTGVRSLPFGQATVSPTSIIAGAPEQDLRVKVALSRSVAADELQAKLYRSPLPDSPETGRNVTRFSLGTRSVDLGNAHAGSERTLSFSNLNAPPGIYRLDLLTRDGARPAHLVQRAAAVVYGQNRLPSGRVGGGRSSPKHPEARRPAARSAAASASRSLGGDEVNHDVNAQFGEQSETFVAVQPNDPARVIAGVNPAGTGPQAWISNDFMKPGTAVERTLPSSSLRSTSEGGGVITPSLCCDPTFAADELGNLWYAVVAFNPGSHIVINRVAAGGTTFQSNNVAIPRFTTKIQDKPMITIDNTATSPKRGMLYAVWVENPGQNVVFSQCNTRPGGTPSAANCDDPDNWSVPQVVTASAGGYTYPSVAAAPNGDVYVAWQNYGPEPSGNDIEMDRCLAAEDCTAAASWNEEADVANLDASSGTELPFFCPIISAPAGRVGPQTYVDVGPNGRVYVAYSNLRANGTTKCTASGTDRTFDSFIAASSSANAFPALNSGVRLSDDGAGALNDHFFAALTADQSTSGEVQANLYSTKSDPSGQTTQQYYVGSTNNGASYSSMIQISTQASDFSGAQSTANDYGDYIGADSAGGRMFPTWTDNRAFHGGDAELYMLTSPSETEILSGPTGTTGDTTPTFTFTSNSPGLPAPGFDCSMDFGSFLPCTSPLTTATLAYAPHTFRVRSTDVVGNPADLTPASQSFTVQAPPPPDTTPPNTTINKARINQAKRKATFKFTSNEPGSSFHCKLDRKPYRACSSPKTYRHLKHGRHKFRVKARDSAGNVDPTPAVKKFRIS